MATDWIADVKKHAPNADDAVLEKMHSSYRMVLSHADSALVSFSDPEECKTVRENYLKKKLGLTQSDAELDAGIAEIGEKHFKGSRRNGRLAVYYLLAEKYGKLGVFS